MPAQQRGGGGGTRRRHVGALGLARGAERLGEHRDGLRHGHRRGDGEGEGEGQRGRDRRVWGNERTAKGAADLC